MKCKIIARYFKKPIRDLYKLAVIFIFSWLVILNIYQYTYQSFKYKVSPTTTSLVVDELKNTNELELFQRKISNVQFKNKIDCKLVFKNDKNEIKKAEKLIVQFASEIKTINDEKYIFDKSYCALFRQIRGYDSHPIKESEYEFPLAFSILVHYNVEQLERLLKLIYRPHNLYCIHIDSKSSIEVHKAIQSIVQCFDNVFISSKLEDIVYAGISRLKADINCMYDLVHFKHNRTYNKKPVSQWKYFINLVSTEFPLRTNYELTEILRLFNGANDIEVLFNYPGDRVKYKYIIGYRKNERTLIKTGKLKDPPPHNFSIAKGIAFGHFSYDFVQFVLKDNHAIDLLNWAEDTYSPDEW